MERGRRPSDFTEGGPLRVARIETVEIGVTDARAALADLVNRVAYRGERVVLTRHGKAVAAIVSAEDLELLDRLRGRRLDLAGTGPADEPAAENAAAQQLPAVPGAPMRVAAEHRPQKPRRPGFGR